MVGVQINVTLDDAAARDRLAHIEAGLVDTRPLMDALGVVLVDGTLRRFEQGVGPDGAPWEPSLRAQMTGGQTLVDSGLLMSSITHQAAEDEVRVGTNVPYALIHQTGGEIVPVNAGALRFQLADGTFVTAGKVTIPARPFLGIDDEDVAGIEEHVELFIDELLR